MAAELGFDHSYSDKTCRIGSHRPKQKKEDDQDWNQVRLAPC